MAHGESYYDSTFTDTSGAFTLPHVPAGSVAIEATTSFRQGVSAGAQLDIPEDGPPIVDVALDFSGQSRLSGTVTRAGRPAASVMLNASPIVPTTSTRGRAESQRDGAYRIDGLSDGQYQLVVSGPFGTYRRTVDVQGWTEYDIDLPAGSIGGTVIDAMSHEAIGNVVVTAATGKERSVAEARRAVTDSRGTYALTDLDPGTYQVRATRTGYRQDVQVVEVRQTDQHRDFELQRHSDVKLHVFDRATGAPVSQAAVRAAAYGVLAFADSVAFDTTGRADIPDLAPGEYLLTVLVVGYAPRTLALTVPATAVDVAIERGGRVLLDLAGGTSTRVRLVDSAGVPQAMPGADASGWAAIAGPAAVWPNVGSGSYRLESMTGGVTQVVVRPGATSVVEVR